MFWETTASDFPALRGIVGLHCTATGTTVAGCRDCCSRWLTLRRDAAHGPWGSAVAFSRSWEGKLKHLTSQDERNEENGKIATGTRGSLDRALRRCAPAERAAPAEGCVVPW